MLTYRVREDAITVIATGSPSFLEDSGQSLSIITAAELDEVQGPDLVRALTRLPGVTITRNGGVGSFTGLRVRGADAEQLLVLIDGVRGADVAAPGGGFDLGNVLSGNIAKAELLRGSNSVVWGSQAIGGVLALTTQVLNGVKASAEYGANDTSFVTATAGIDRDGISAALNAGYYDSDGISSAATGSEADGFRQWRIGGRAAADLAPGLKFTAAATYSEGRLEIDGYPAPDYLFADTGEYQDTRSATGRIGTEYTAGGIALAGGFSLADTRRDLFDPALGSASYFSTIGRSERADLSARFALAEGAALLIGADREWSRFSTSFDAERRAVLTSGHALLTLSRGELDIAGGARIDDHDRFGSAVTVGANASLGVGGGWRLRASYGESFKAPTLYQLYSDYGNQALNPERSRSYDIGIEQGDRGSGVHFAATVFRRDSRELIDFVSCASVGACGTRPFGLYANVGLARAEGFELEANVAVTPAFMARAGYSYVKAMNRTSGSANEGNDLARRPRHAVSTSLDWETPLAGLAIGGDLQLASDSFDDAGNFTPLGGYFLGTLRASLPLGERFEIFGRIENLFDARYQTVAGYGTPGRAAFAGARIRL